MVLRCAWGTCNSDERYPNRLVGVKFYRFPNPKHSLEKCLRWIKSCCRPHEQLNITRLNKHKAVCSKHFHGGLGPTKEYPDPFSADGSPCTPARKLPTKRPAPHTVHNQIKKRLIQEIPIGSEESEERHSLHPVDEEPVGPDTGVSTQTEGSWIEPIDVLALAAENRGLKNRVACLQTEIFQLKMQIKKKDEALQRQSEQVKTCKTLSVNIVQQKESKLKNLFTFYTGITIVRFLGLLSFLVPSLNQIDYKCKRSDLKNFANNDGLFLTLCRLRHAFELKDIATRFGLSLQSAGIVFNTWLDCMFFKFGQLSIWPHRETIISKMPEGYKKDFPTSLIIIDGTEIKTHSPKAMHLQSQLYSTYKSSTTLKCLIGCDPRGNLMFVSELFTGSISDKALTEKSGFYEILKILKEHGYVLDGDAIMVDKGFNIEKEVNDLGLLLNIPPFAASGSQMSVSDTYVTQKIAKHRVHIERLIRKVKTYKIVSNCVPTALFQSINKIWSVCCYMTLFQDVFVKDKVK